MGVQMLKFPTPLRDTLTNQEKVQISTLMPLCRHIMKALTLVLVIQIQIQGIMTILKVQISPSSNDNSNFGQSHNTGTDYTGICNTLQPVLVGSCDTLVNSDGSLTSDGTHSMHCIRNGILLGTGASLVGVPLPWVLKGLSILAAPTGCGDVVQMSGFKLLGNIGSLHSLVNLLP